MRRIITLFIAGVLMAVSAVPAVADGHELNIVEAVLADDGEFDVLQAAVIATGFDADLAEDGPFTVFAPTDKAFEKLAEDLSGEDFESDAEVVAWLVDNVGLTTIAAVLAYHVAEGAVPSSTVVGLDGVTTLGGDIGIFYPGGNFRSLQFVDNDPDARNPKLVKGLFDIEVSNGIIHGIDRVLRPIDL